VKSEHFLVLRMTTVTRRRFQVPHKKDSNSTQFYSTVGKIRLSKLWSNQDLDTELLHSNWVDKGPNRLWIQEQVSDYMQHYLLCRYKELV